MDPWCGVGYQQVLARVLEHVPWNALTHVHVVQALFAHPEFYQALAYPGLERRLQAWIHHHRVLRLSHLQ